MNIMKLPPVMTKSVQTSIGVYLNDYYMVYDAAREDHDVDIVQLKKAIKEQNLEAEDQRIKALRNLRQAILLKYNCPARVSKKDTERYLSKAQHGVIKKTLEHIKLQDEYRTDDDVVLFFDCLQLTGVIVQLTQRFYVETCFKRKAERREFLLKGDMKHYSLSVDAYQKRRNEL
mmetsp:Transcript_4976/g.6629  ORF Transcript_4976/g.6629 Transcript_4976/m.6629 type:complete len:174 (+) Transcript_4976:970-1491(+)